METTLMNPGKAFVFFGLSLAIATLGIYVADADDAPGAAVIGMLLMVAAVVLGVRAARMRLPTWVARTALVAGILVAAFAAFVIHRTVVTAPLFPPEEVPSVAGSAPPPQYAPGVGRARELVRAAVTEQNLPGVSVAVGVGLLPAASAKEGTVVWAEGFGWRDVATRTPVTPDTRFNIGTAARVVSEDAILVARMTSTGTDSAAEWSPSHNGEPEDDFPLFTIIRHVVFEPIGLAPERPLPGERATFYVPRSDDNPRTGRRLIYMRDLACCANGMTFYSTPSDLVRFAMATNADSVNGELAGGMVMSLVTRRDTGIAVAVASNITHANTSSLAQRVADAFAEPRP